jgi:hypothetical protein
MLSRPSQGPSLDGVFVSIGNMRAYWLWTPLPPTFTRARARADSTRVRDFPRPASRGVQFVTRNAADLDYGTAHTRQNSLEEETGIHV